MEMMKDAMSGEMPEGEMGTCIKLYAAPDGSYTVSKSQEQAPEDGQPAASLDEAMELIRQMAQEPEGEEDMESAMKGYAKKAQPPMKAPNPEGLFGE